MANTDKASEVSWDETDPRSFYSLSLSKIKTHRDLVGYPFKPTPFNMEWVHGFNHKSGLINLNCNGSTNAFYAASNCAVIYNWTARTMKILRGHRHMVTCIAADENGRWLVTGDSGPDNIIIIWDARDYFPQRTIFSPHQNNRLAKLALSADAKYLLTLAYGETPCLYWWIWSFGLDAPNALIAVPFHKDAVIDMAFNPKNSSQFLLLTKKDIWIGISEVSTSSLRRQFLLNRCS